MVIAGNDGGNSGGSKTGVAKRGRGRGSGSGRGRGRGRGGNRGGGRQKSPTDLDQQMDKYFMKDTDIGSKKLDEGMDDYWKHRGNETYAASVDINKGEKEEYKSEAGGLVNEAKDTINTDSSVPAK